MTGWALLTLAILAEVTGTLALRTAAAGRRAWWAVVGIGYLVAFTSLAATIGQCMPLGVAYGIWAAAGVALTALGSRVCYGEPLTRVMMLGIGLIMAGVLLVELGAAH